MKHKILALALSISLLAPSAHAVLLGGYGSVGLGQTRIQIPGGNAFNVASFDDGQTHTLLGGLDGKIMLGYNVSKYFGVEASFADYATSSYTAYVPHGPSANMEYSMSALNLVMKGYVPLPISNDIWFHFDPYGLLGMAETWSTVSYHNTGIPFSNDFDASQFTIGNTDTSSLRPIFGGGVNYDIPNTVISLAAEFTRIQGTGSIKTNSRAIPSAEMLTINVSYNFTPPKNP